MLEDDTRLHIRAWRIAHDLSQRDLAKIAGVSRKTMGKWERGESKWDENTLTRLIDDLAPLSADMLDYPIDNRARVDRQYNAMRKIIAINAAQNDDRSSID